VVFAWIGWLLSLIACIAIFATHKSASKLLRARNEQRQKEADLNRSRSAGGGGRVDGGGGGDSDILKEEADEKGGLEKTLGDFFSLFPLSSPSLLLSSSPLPMNRRSPALVYHNNYSLVRQRKREDDEQRRVFRLGAI